MRPLVEVTAFETGFAAGSDSLEQEEQLGPGYGEECDAGARVVRGKLLRVLNPSGHLSFALPPGACGSDGDAEGENGVMVLLLLIEGGLELYFYPFVGG